MTPSPRRPVVGRLHQVLATGLRHFGLAAATVQGRSILFATGEQQGAGARPALLALDADGSVLWRDAFDEEPGRIAMGAEPHVLDLGGGRMAVGHFVAHRESGAPGVFRVLSPLDGEEIWRVESGSLYGGNRDVHSVDLDGDGAREVLIGFADRLVCCRASDGAVLWSRVDGMRICWGRSAIADINGDGRLEVVLGSEYGNPDGTSSIFALRADGSTLWEYGGIEGDCGSTPAFVADGHSDGGLEILKAEIDLEGRGPVRMARLWCLRADGSLLWRSDLGGGDIAVGDLDGDGVLEAVGATSGRDGGTGVSPSLFCVELRSGRERWRIPLPRHWLTGWPVLLDANGDGLPEAAVPLGNPSGYGKRASEPPWGEVYVVKGNGTVLSRLHFPDFVLAPLPCGAEGQAPPRLLVPCGDGHIYTYAWG